MLPLLLILLAAVLAFIGYWYMTTSSRNSGSVAPQQPRTPSAKSSAAPAPADDEEEATRVRVDGPRLIRTMGGLKIGEEIGISGVVTVGRGQASTVRLNDAELSAVHAQFQILNGVPVVIDLGSTNGTSLNDEKIEPNTSTILHDGDQIKVGNTTLVFKQSK